MIGGRKVSGKQVKIGDSEYTEEEWDGETQGGIKKKSNFGTCRGE